jgi:hypothetical protein
MRPLSRRLALAALALALAGCGGSNALESPTAKKLKSLSSLYASFAVGQNGNGPKTEKEFKDYVLKLPPQQLPLGIEPSNREVLFVSDRDGQPFVVVPGVSIRGMSGTSAPVVAHEQAGVGGRKLVAFANSKLEEADEARLKELVAPPKP